MGRTGFDDLLARLSRRERAAFVGALLAARGWDVDIDPPVIRATRGDQSKVVAIAREGLVRGHGLPHMSVDAVVGVAAERTERLAGERDAHAWDARTLYDMARHGLDPDATDCLFGDHFGTTTATVSRPTTAGPPDVGTEKTDETGASGEDRAGVETGSAGATTSLLADRGRQWLVPLFLIVVVVVGGALSAQALIGTPLSDAANDGERASGNTGASPPSTSASTATPTPEPQSVIPGVSSSGFVDTAVLASGHATALTNRSFTMYLTYAEQVDGETVGRAREVVRVENRTVYRSTGTRSGNLASDLQPVIIRDLYADGDGRYLRQEDGALRVGNADDPGTGQVVERSRALIAWYLSGTDSTLVGSTRQTDRVYYRVDVEGTSDRRAENYRARGLVSEDGLVVYVDARYRIPETDRIATVSLEYVDVENTNVARPTWMPPDNESAT